MVVTMLQVVVRILRMMVKHIYVLGNHRPSGRLVKALRERGGGLVRMMMVTTARLLVCLVEVLRMMVKDVYVQAHQNRSLGLLKSLKERMSKRVKRG
jgi:hypothetical protein